jgi:hypothetical protein
MGPLALLVVLFGAIGGLLLVSRFVLPPPR